jgi:hypothetical protein
VRDKNISDAINSLKSKYIVESEAQDSPATIGNEFAEIKKEVSKPQAKTSGTPNISVEQYNNLVKRLEKLEDSFAKYKKAQLVKLIIELGLPVIMVIIILIILLSSGLFDMLSNFASYSK